MVVVNLYRFEEVAAKAGARLEELIENIDIGGPTMIRAAAKNYQDVAVVVSPVGLRRHPRRAARRAADLSRDTKWRLAKKAFRTTADYDAAISARLEQVDDTDGALPARPRHPRAQADGPALRREPASVRRALRHAAARASPAPSSCRARNSPTTTWWISTPPGSWSTSSTRPAVGHHQAHQSLRLRRAGHAGRGLSQGVRSAIRSRPSAA